MSSSGIWECAVLIAIGWCSSRSLEHIIVFFEVGISTQDVKLTETNANVGVVVNVDANLLFNELLEPWVTRSTFVPSIPGEGDLSRCSIYLATLYRHMRVIRTCAINMFSVVSEHRRLDAVHFRFWGMVYTCHNITKCLLNISCLLRNSAS